MSKKLISILTIAGSDCSGGAGIQADIRAAAMRNVYASTVVTAITVQNSHGLKMLFPTVPPALIGQFCSIFEDTRPDAIKVGMLGSLENARIVSDFLRQFAQDIPIVVDPVIKASTGGDLSVDAEAMIEYYMLELCPLATVVTPNLEEVEKFGCRKDNVKDMAVSLLDKLGCKAVVIKGGHSDSDLISDTLAELYYEGCVNIETVSASRIKCENLHGTGCVYSSLLASELAKGHSISEAFHTTSWLMKTIISESAHYSLGESHYGPLNLANYRADNHNQKCKKE